MVAEKSSQYEVDTTEIIWWMNPRYFIGNIVHKSGSRIYIYYRDRYEDDATYALVNMEDGESKLICTLWLGNLSDDWKD